MKNISLEEENEFRSLLKEHTNAEIARYNDLKSDIKDLRESVNDLISTWNQAKGVLSFFKWIVGGLGGLTAFILFLKDHFRW